MGAELKRKSHRMGELFSEQRGRVVVGPSFPSLTGITTTFAPMLTQSPTNFSQELILWPQWRFPSCFLSVLNENRLFLGCHFFPIVLN